jgi:hypothetical protein
METTDPAQTNEPIVSEAADSLDSLVQQASLPTLATLFKRAKDRGVLNAGPEYLSTSNK